MSETGGTRTVVVDTNVLVNLIHLDRLDLLGALPGWAFVAPDLVIAEVTVPEQAQKLATALDRCQLRQEPIVGAECSVYADLKQVMGKGEAASLAMAQARGWLIASDEQRRVLRYAREMLGSDRILNTPGILLLAIRAGALSIEDADEAKSVLEHRRFRMKFASFGDLLGD